ncbi:MAG: hypothetical protein QNL68_12205, partial [Akkermansiaceae bacterium]
FDDIEGFEAFRKSAGVVDFVRISGHSGSMQIPDSAYIFKLNKITTGCSGVPSLIALWFA